jgi:hypothetical protein
LAFDVIGNRVVWIVHSLPSKPYHPHDSRRPA